MPFEFEVVMSQQPVEKRSVPWLLMGLGLLIPIFIVGMAFLAARSALMMKPMNRININPKIYCTVIPTCIF